MEVLLLGTVQQCLAEVQLREQKLEEVGCCHTVKRFGTVTEVQSSLKDTVYPLLVLTQ